MPALTLRNDFFDDFFRDMRPGYFVRPLRGDPLPSPEQIRMDVNEEDREYTVSAEVPGVKKEDIRISLDGNVVTLSAEVKQESENKEGKKTLRTERYYGSVARSIQLPQDVDAAQAKARYDNGVLTLTLPKKAGNSAQQLKIE